MLKAYSVFKDLDKKACEILINAGIQLDISTSEERPNKEELSKLLDDYDILIIGIKEKMTEDMITKIDEEWVTCTADLIEKVNESNRK